MKPYHSDENEVKIKLCYLEKKMGFSNPDQNLLIHPLVYTDSYLDFQC